MAREKLMVLSRVQCHADVPGVEFADNIAVVGLTGLLDAEPDERQRAGLVSSGPLLGRFRFAWAVVVTAPPAKARSATFPGSRTRTFGR